MRRLHLFEFEDQPWLPSSLRHALLEVLQRQITSCRLYAPVVGKLKEAVEECGWRHLVDIGSGGGETALQVQEMLAHAGCPVSLTLTDKYPPAAAVAGAGGRGTRYVPESVDALRIPEDVRGFRVFFTSFHHFPPRRAAAILKRAVDDGTPVGVFEFTERTPSNLAGMLLSPLAVLALTRKMRPRYVVPLVPLLYWWDGTVSHLRTYTVAELEQLIPDGNDFRWEVGQIEGDGYRLTYLIGISSAGTG